MPPDRISLTRYLIEEQRAGRIGPDLRLLIEVVARACKSISVAVGKGGPRGKDFNMRWVASMVADVHRILTRGGIFTYPIDAKCRDKGGRLRLMYEANPMALLVEQAGGAASTGRGRLLEVAPTQLHQRVPVFLGSKREVENAERYHADIG